MKKHLFLAAALSLPLIILLLVPFNGFAQEDQHKHGHHRHPEYAKKENSIAKTGKSIAEGKKLYERYCIVCHGKAGKGIIGSNLTGPVLIHGSTDGEIFHVITDGVVGTVMKGFRNELSEEMRWHLVNYITSLKKSK
jgi:mono/diheme cytochrome c family protein